MPRNYEPVIKPYTEATIAMAVAEVEEGAKIKRTAEKYHMSTTLLRKRLMQHRGDITLKKQVSS